MTLRKKLSSVWESMVFTQFSGLCNFRELFARTLNLASSQVIAMYYDKIYFGNVSRVRLLRQCMKIGYTFQRTRIKQQGIKIVFGVLPYILIQSQTILLVSDTKRPFWRKKSLNFHKMNGLDFCDVADFSCLKRVSFVSSCYFLRLRLKYTSACNIWFHILIRVCNILIWNYDEKGCLGLLFLVNPMYWSTKTVLGQKHYKW